MRICLRTWLVWPQVNTAWIALFKCKTKWFSYVSVIFYKLAQKEPETQEKINRIPQKKKIIFMIYKWILSAMLASTFILIWIFFLYMIQLEISPTTWSIIYGTLLISNKLIIIIGKISLFQWFWCLESYPLWTKRYQWKWSIATLVLSSPWTFLTIVFTSPFIYYFNFL